METTRVSLIHRLQAADNAEAWHEFAGIYRPILLRYARPVDCERTMPRTSRRSASL